MNVDVLNTTLTLFSSFTLLSQNIFFWIVSIVFRQGKNICMRIQRICSFWPEVFNAYEKRSSFQQNIVNTHIFDQRQRRIVTSTNMTPFIFNFLWTIHFKNHSLALRLGQTKFRKRNQNSGYAMKTLIIFLEFFQL